MTESPASLDNEKELIALVDLLVDAAKDGIQIAASGAFIVTKLAVLENLVMEIQPAFANIGMVPAEVKVLTFEQDEAIVLHIVQKLGVTNAKALSIVNGALSLAADIVHLIGSIQAPASSA